MTLIFDPMCGVDHQKRKMFMHWYNSDNLSPVKCGVDTRDCDWFKSLLTEHEWLHSDVSGFFFNNLVVLCPFFLTLINFCFVASR